MTDTVNVQNDVRRWDFYPIVMPLTKDGNGPASAGEINRLTWEVWDRCHQSHASYDNLSDAINDCMSSNALAAAPKAEPVDADDFGDALLAFLFRHGLKVALDVSEIEALRQSAIRDHPAPASDELLEALDGYVRRFDSDDHQSLDEFLSELRALIAKHKGPQS